MALESSLSKSRGEIYVDEYGRNIQVNRSFVNASASGDTAVVAAQGANIKIRVVGILVVSSAAMSIKFRSNTTDISPAFPFAANGGMAPPINMHGWFETAANEALNVNLSAANAAGVQIIWIPVSTTE
jgi:hypothetical protein